MESVSGKYPLPAVSCLVFGLIIGVGSIVSAQTLPGAADINRIETHSNATIEPSSSSPLFIPETTPDMSVPATAKHVHIHLNKIIVEGATIMSEAELSSIYAQYLEREVTLDVVWMIAERITTHYRNAGYFLSRAYVPQQEIEGGQVRIRIVEGYIANVHMEGELLQQAVIQKHIHQISSHRPIKADILESFMLTLNDLAGFSFRAFLEPYEAAEGGVKLTLKPAAEQAILSVNIDNSGSRFLGPYQGSITYQDSFIPLHQTRISTLTSLPTQELQYVSLTHEIPLYPNWNLDIDASYVTARPGATLSSSNIDSDSVELGFGVNWQLIRQRQENMNLSLRIGGKNTNGDILDNNPLTRDRIRTAQLHVNYDKNDKWDGYNYLSFSLNQGLGILGSSNANDPNLSRAQAEPNFTSFGVSYTRLQSIDDGWLLIGQTSGQYASDPLFSSEEFGYGGQRFGRAYDPSEITGDHGIAGALELRYLNLPTWQNISLTPYGFYDIGRVWNEDIGSKPISASSAGLGIRAAHIMGISGNIGIAWPLTKQLDTPIYGDENDPRLLLQIGMDF